MPPHRIYCEHFCGGSAVFFAKPPSYLEALNDTNDRLITFYKQVASNFEALQELVEATLHSEAEYLRAREIYYGRTEATEVEIAWATWLVTNLSFSATPRGGWKWCNGSAGSHCGVYLKRRRDEFTTALKERLSTVQISCRDALEAIKMRDTPETLFYIDPPYPGAEQKHYSGYTYKDLEGLLETLAAIKGKFILSNYNSPLLQGFITEHGWSKEEIDLPLMTANFKTPKRKTEVLVMNFAPQKQSNLFDEY